MDKEPLISNTNARMSKPFSVPSILFPVPEDDIVSSSLPLTPSELKERLIFGSSPKDFSTSSSLVDALNLTLNSPKLSHSVSADLSTTTAFIDPQSESHQTVCLNDFDFQKSNLHRSKTAPAMAVINDYANPVVAKPPQFGSSSSIVSQAVLLLILYLCLGVGIYWSKKDDFRSIETNPVVDALYFCIVTMCTIGYGDITPNSTVTKLFSVMFVLIGFGFIDILLSGMVSYVLDLQENHLLRTVKVGVNQDRRSYIIDFKKGRMRIRMKVALALGVVVLCIGVGVTVMHFVEGLGWLDSLYLSVMSVTTVGYGDRAFSTLAGRVFASIWLLVSTLAVARAFLYLAEARVHRRHRKMENWVLGQDLTVSQFLAADIDNNGFVSKSEYVVYKLKEMEKVSQKDVAQICKTFDRLDAGNCGRITLADLMQNHHHES
ncbi:Two-pore potassium channel 3 [Heracleum sosnowskyi]|uniref:Two-pore potassium channel 3 n=1 Tax=Heracleum sosnowskyi TaxID=360622 RepID=A0AAD8IAN8_9APIA|nr:Two-pore potassium channel 3 [Heracleum sosnowskyi]